MSAAKFPKLIDYDALKRQYGESQDSSSAQSYTNAHNAQINPSPQPVEQNQTHVTKADVRDAQVQEDDLHEPETATQNTGTLTGTRLRSYAFAVLTRKEYSKKDLIDKLCLYALNRDEVIELVNELAQENYQSDQRVAEMTVRSQIRKGKGPNRIKLALQAKSIDKQLAKDDIEDIDWYAQAYELKVKKYGTEVAKDPKLKAKQIRFLQYRGFEMDSIMKAIQKRADDD